MSDVDDILKTVTATHLVAAGARRLVLFHDGSGEPFEAYDKKISDKTVHGLMQRIAKLKSALGEITMVPQGYGPDSTAIDIARDALFEDEPWSE